MAAASSSGDHNGGGMMIDTPAKLIWGEISSDHMLTTALPFPVTLTAVGEDKEPLPDYSGQLTISALTTKVCLSEGFEGQRLGLWYARAQPSHSAHFLCLHLARLFHARALSVC